MIPKKDADNDVVGVVQGFKDCIVFPVMATIFGFPASPPDKPHKIPVIPDVVAEEVREIVLFRISPHTPEETFIPNTAPVEPMPPEIKLLITFKPR